MSDDLVLDRERLRQNVTQRQQERDATTPKAPAAATPGRASFLPGSAVFDSVSGQEGVVVSVAYASKQRTDTVFVRLESSGLVARGPEQLIARPAAPSL